MPAEGVGPFPVKVPGEPADPGQHLHRRDIEVGPLAPPGLDDAVDLILLVTLGHGPDRMPGLDDQGRAGLRSSSVRGMVAANPTMPAQSTAGTIIACWMPSR